MSHSQGFLVLEDGTVFSGEYHGSQRAGEDFSSAGEVVFNTSHSGYEEIATDPSYFSQIVVMTAPMQGNYGIKKERWESSKMWIKGFVCLELCDSNPEWRNELQRNQVPALSGVDTRMLTMKLRSGGTPWGAVVVADNQAAAVTKAKELIAKQKQIQLDWVHLASRPTQEPQKGGNLVGPKLAIMDFGSKENILREAKALCSEYKIFNSRSSIAEILKYNPDALLLTNGPGNPEDVQVAPGVVKELLGFKPIMGICMGHQILGLALGAKTYKLKFGHRGANHPIKDDLLNKVYVSSQNHGYAVEEASLPSDVKVTHRNLNDQSVAGFFSESRKILGIQYHPESCPGPHEARELFNYFFEKIV